jgi:hypothetical protein
VAKAKGKGKVKVVPIDRRTRWIQQHRAEGLCRVCTRKAKRSGGKVFAFCQPHLVAHRDASRKRMRKRRAAIRQAAQRRIARRT